MSAKCEHGWFVDGSQEQDDAHYDEFGSSLFACAKVDPRDFCPSCGEHLTDYNHAMAHEVDGCARKP